MSDDGLARATVYFGIESTRLRHTEPLVTKRRDALTSCERARRRATWREKFLEQPLAGRFRVSVGADVARDAEGVKRRSPRPRTQPPTR